MRKVKEVLRLRFELGFGQRQIARSCRMGLSTVHEYLERAAAAGISWPLPEDWSEEELEGKLFGQQPIQSIPARQRPQPDWKTIHEQLQQHRHLTLQLVWEEYRQGNPEDPFRGSPFFSKTCQQSSPHGSTLSKYHKRLNWGTANRDARHTYGTPVFRESRRSM